MFPTYSCGMDSSKNLNISCPFGPALVESRNSYGISQSRLSILAACNVTNLRKIEKGTMQPGVSMAVRLVAAIGTDVGDFFQKLAEDNLSIPLPDVPGSGGMPKEKDSFIKGLLLPEERERESKSIFGLMFKEVRVHYGVTQKVAAESAGYNLRNLHSVESGSQEPGIMTALALVSATGANVESFFDRLHWLLEEHRFIA